MIKLIHSWKIIMEKKNIERKICDMFPTFERCHPSNETETNKKLFISHLSALQKQLWFYFKDVDVSTFERVRNPFAANNVSRPMTREQ